MSNSPHDKFADWIRYYNDIGIPAFYRGRTTAFSKVAPTQKAPAKPTPAAPPVEPKPVISAGPWSRQTERGLFDAVETVIGDSLEKIRADIGPDCRRCKLCEKRTHIVFSDGNPNAKLVFVGEG